MTCKQTARYVIVETTYNAEEDDKDGEYGAILEICEIEVYGMHYLYITPFYAFCLLFSIQKPANDIYLKKN